MFMRINWGKIKPGSWEEYEKRYIRVADEQQQASGGPVARWLLRDMDDPDAGYAVSLWNTEQDLRNYSSSPETRKKIEAEFGELFTGEFSTKLCEVRHSTDYL